MARPPTWDETLDICYAEITKPEYSKDWEKFKTLTKTEDMVHSVYRQDFIRKKYLKMWVNMNKRKRVEAGTIKNENASKEPIPIESEFKEMVSDFFRENYDFLSASEKITIRENKAKGRHVIATEEIKAGDVLFNEKPFSWVLCDSEKTNCDYCTLLLPNNPARCETCGLGYCSKECLQNALKMYHKRECGSFLGKHVGIANLGLRTTLIAESLNCIEDNTSDEQYARVMSLLTHLDDLNPEDKFRYATTAVLLVMDQIKERNIHGVMDRLNFMRKFGGRVLYHLIQMICNGNAIVSYQQTGSGDDKVVVLESQKRIATAIYPSTSMMNHSCDPNIFVSYVGKNLIGKASIDIKKGEEIFHCYGPHYTTDKNNQRKMILRNQYFFNCDCKYCSSKIDFLEKSGFETLTCFKCSGPIELQSKKCLDCQRELTRDEFFMINEKETACHELHIQYDSLLEDGNYPDAVKYLKDILTLKKQYLNKYNKEISKTYDALAYTLSNCAEYTEAFKYIKLSLEILEKCFGSNSIQVLGVLFTMCDIGFMALCQNIEGWDEFYTEVLEICNRTGKIVKLLYGDWHYRMEEVQHHKKQIIELKNNKSLDRRL